MEESERYPADGISIDNNEAKEITDEAVAKRARRRAKIVKEMLDTEKTYQYHLELVIKYFEGPVRELNFVPDHVVVTIFSNIRQILSINQELMEHLTKTGVGYAFLRMGPFLKLYSTYANNHERALGAMIEWEQKKPEFGAWRRVQEELPEMKGLKLNSLLITPVQRVPRYKLLLTDLLENTETDHKDYGAIQEAVKQIGAVASHINEHIRQQDNFNKMLAIQKCLAGHGAPRILTPGRIFIKDGPLKKVSKKGGRSHERMFFLFSDILLYAKPKFVDQVLSGSYVTCCILPLQHCKVDTVFGHSQSSGSLFTVTCKNESLLLYSDQKTVQSWLKVLRNAIQTLQTSRKTLRKPSSALQPLRRPGLVRLRKAQKRKDPLETAKRTPERTNASPRSLKRALAEANINCLTPRRQKVLKQEHSDTPSSIICQNLNNVLNSIDKDTSGSLPDVTLVGESPMSTTESNKPSAGSKLIARMRHISGKTKKKTPSVECPEKENVCAFWGCVSPQRDNKVEPQQGSECDINEILDPTKAKWDIFDLATPDSSVVWRPALDAELLQQPQPQNSNEDDEAEEAAERILFPRPWSAISENTSRVWKARPGSEISDTDDLSTIYFDSPSHLSSELCDDEGDSDYVESPRSQSRSKPYGCRTDCGDLTSRYTFNEDDPNVPVSTFNGDSRVSHTSIQSLGSVSGYKVTGANPWRYTEETYISEGEEDLSQNSWSDGEASRASPSWTMQPDLIPPEWLHSGYSGSVYADQVSPQKPTHSNLQPILENESASSNSQTDHLFSSCPDVGAVDTPSSNHTPEKSDQYQTRTPQPKSPWKAIGDTVSVAGGAAQNVIRSPVMMNGQSCVLQ